MQIIQVDRVNTKPTERPVDSFHYVGRIAANTKASFAAKGQTSLRS